MKQIIVRELLRFVFIAILLFGIYQVVRPMLYDYHITSVDGTMYFNKFDRLTGDVYRFDVAKGKWVLMSK